MFSLKISHSFALSVVAIMQLHVNTFFCKHAWFMYLHLSEILISYYEINISLRCKYINHACLQKNVLTCSCIIATTESANECDKV